MITNVLPPLLWFTVYNQKWVNWQNSRSHSYTQHNCVLRQLNQYRSRYPSLFRNFAGRLQFSTRLSSFQYPVILFGIDVQWLVTVVHDVLRLCYCRNPLDIWNSSVARYHLHNRHNCYILMLNYAQAHARFSNWGKILAMVGTLYTSVKKVHNFQKPKWSHNVLKLSLSPNV